MMTTKSIDVHLVGQSSYKTKNSDKMSRDNINKLFNNRWSLIYLIFLHMHNIFVPILPDIRLE